jgi:Mce-associated membrane protein
MSTAVTTSVATPSWYDVLDVAPDSCEKDIRTAWRSAIADLDPSDRRFRVLNQAAEVLLDRRKRAEYDAELAAQLAAQLDSVRVDEPDAEEAGEPVASDEAAASARRTAWVPPGWLLVAVAAVAALVVGACAAVVAGDPGGARVADATRQAQSAAERAIVPVLSYDASDMAGSQKAAEGYLTADYQEEYDKLFAVLEENAGRTGTVVTAQVVASAVVRSGDDRVSVLLFVNRPTTNKQVKRPVVYKDQVTVTMQKVGDSWLIDNLVTSPTA